MKRRGTVLEVYHMQIKDYFLKVTLMRYCYPSHPYLLIHDQTPSSAQALNAEGNQERKFCSTRHLAHRHLKESEGMGKGLHACFEVG